MKAERLREFINGLEILDPIFLRNVALYPVRASEFEPKCDFLTLDDGCFSISELDPPRVDTIMFRNLSERPVLLLDGEGIMGARQDRVVNTSVWLEGGRSYELPVSCVEERRWAGGVEFHPARALLNPSLRWVLCDGVSRSLSENRGYKSDQRALWSSITKTLSSLRVSSKTRSINDAYKSLKDEIESYMEELRNFSVDFSGVIIETSNLLAVDLFGSKTVLRRFWNKLLGSYLLEGFLSGGRVSISINKVKRFIGSISVIDIVVYDSPSGVGEEARFLMDAQMGGKALFLDEGIVHLSLFKVKK